MKFKILILLLLIPQIASAYYVRYPCCYPLQACSWWGNADYMLLWRKNRFYPPLVTTNPSAPPILGEPGTTVLFGGGPLRSPPKNAFGGDLGIWISRCIALGFSAYVITEFEKSFVLNGNAAGFPIFGQPFFNTFTGAEDVNLLSFGTATLPVLVNGHIDIETNNRNWGFDLFGGYKFLNLCSLKFNLLAGFLYNYINDNITVNSSTTLGTITARVGDKITAENRFYGGMVGFLADWKSCSWGIHVVGKVGLGNMQRLVKLHGLTTTVDTSTGIMTTVDSGFLVQPSNTGTFVHWKFDTISQISASLQLKIWKHMWATVGYTGIYWQNVDLAGEQINLNINPEQTAMPPVGTPSPIFKEKPTNFWEQGLSAGVYFCY